MISRHYFFVTILIFFLLFVPWVSVAQNNPVAALFREAIIAYERQDYPTAIQYFEKAIQLNPENVAAYNFVALAYKQSGASVEKVETILKRAIQIDSSYASAYDNLSKIYYGLGRFQEAEEYALKGLEQDPKMVSSLQTLGWTYLVGISRPDLAVDYFQKTVDLDPSPYAVFGLGVAYIMNDERLYAFETITQLRQMGHENMALELQRMVETDNVEQAIAALSPVKVEVPEVLSIEDHHFEVKEEIPVRLRKPDSADSRRSTRPAMSSPETTQQITPAERLRQLREKSQGQF